MNGLVVPRSERDSRPRVRSTERERILRGELKSREVNFGSRPESLSYIDTLVIRTGADVAD